jgi:cytochrome c oxidase assembly factor CtaG
MTTAIATLVSVASTASDAVGPALLPAVVAAYAVPYAVRACTLARRGRPVPRARIAAFVAGLLALLIALSPLVGGLDEDLLVGHMAEHLLIVDIAALLLVIGCTGRMTRSWSIAHGTRCSAWPPNSERMAERILSPKSAFPRDEKRP